MKKRRILHRREHSLEKIDPWLAKLLEVLHEFKSHDEMSDEAVAEKALMSRPGYSKIVNGKAEPKILSVRNILGAGNRNFGDLICGMGGEDFEHVMVLIAEKIAKGNLSLVPYLCKQKFTDEQKQNLLKFAAAINNFVLKM